MKEFRITMYLRTTTEWDDIANLIEEAIITQGHLVDFVCGESIQVERVEETD